MLEKLLDSFEKLCIQIIIDIILIPITIYKMYRTPNFCYDYPNAELDKPDDEQFRHYLSPIRLSVYTSVLFALLLSNTGQDMKFLQQMKDINMSEKALIIFLIYNGTAFIFSLILLAIKRGEVNSIPFRKLLYSFIYAASYTFVPFFVIMLSLMIMGGSVNIIDSVNGITRGLESGAGAKTLPVILVSAIVIILAIVGMLKMFRAYNHILRHSLDLPKWQETLIAAAFFIAQIAYTNLVLDL